MTWTEKTETTLKEACTYLQNRNILPGQDWDHYGNILISAGIDLRKDILEGRRHIRSALIKRWRSEKSFSTLLLILDNASRKFELYQETYFTWSRTIPDRNEWPEHRLILHREAEIFMKNVSDMYKVLENELASKRTEKFHNEAIGLAILSLVVAIIALALSTAHIW